MFFFLVFGILLCSSSILLINAYRASLAYVPSYELIVEAKISKLFGNGALYVNRNWGSPRRNRNALLEGPYIFEYVPGNISHLRLDLPTEAGARVEFGNIYIRTSDSYRPFAGRKLLSFGTSEIANWQIHTGSWLDKGRVLLTDRRMVEIHIPNAIDLDALLPSPAQTPAHLKIYFASGLAGLGLALALGLFILVALAGHYPNLTRRVVIFATGGACWLQVLLSAFPAHWTFDQYYTLNELFAGKLSDLHPPLSVLSWVFTMDLARFLGFGKLGEIAFLFVLQTTLFWIAAIYVATQFRHTAIAAAMLFAIAATPSTLSLLGDIGKDGQLMIALFLSVAVLHRADKKASLIRHSPYTIQIRGNRTTFPPPRELYPLCSQEHFFVRAEGARWGSAHLLKVIWVVSKLGLTTS